MPSRFLPAGRFHGDPTNKWAPNLVCLEALVADAGFSVSASDAWDDRALVWARVAEDPEEARIVAMDRGFRDVP